MTIILRALQFVAKFQPANWISFLSPKTINNTKDKYLFALFFAAWTFSAGFPDRSSLFVKAIVRNGVNDTTVFLSDVVAITANNWSRIGQWESAKMKNLILEASLNISNAPHSSVEFWHLAVQSPHPEDLLAEVPASRRNDVRASPSTELHSISDRASLRDAGRKWRYRAPGQISVVLAGGSGNVGSA